MMRFRSGMRCRKMKAAENTTPVTAMARRKGVPSPSRRMVTSVLAQVKR